MEMVSALPRVRLEWVGGGGTDFDHDGKMHRIPCVPSQSMICASLSLCARALGRNGNLAFLDHHISLKWLCESSLQYYSSYGHKYSEGFTGAIELNIK